MFIRAIQRLSPLRAIICHFGENRARFLISFFEDYLPAKTKVIDVGAGVCNIARQLEKRDYDVTALDIQNLSMVKDFDPVLYDGHTIPFKDKTFDSGLLVMVMHHAPEFERLFDETARVAKRVVIIEDVYDSWFRKQVTFFFDSLLNLEFRGHPHNNMDDAGWKQFFAERNMRIVGEAAMGSYLVFRHKVYILEPIS